MDIKNLSDIEITPLLDTLKLQKIEDAIYFSAKYNDYISNSRLSLINPDQENDPKAFFEGLSKHSIYSEALSVGSAVHELILQNELFNLVEDLGRPTAKMGFMADELYKYYLNNDLSDENIIKISDKVDYYKGKMNPERISAVREACSSYWENRKKYEEIPTLTTPIYLDSRNIERVKQCVRALNHNRSIYKLLHPKGFLTDPYSENEQAILLNVEVKVPNYEPFIFKLKAKVDHYSIDTESNIITVNDVKTIGKIVSEFQGNFQRFHYYRELSIYVWLLTLVAKKYHNIAKCKVKSNCLIVSTIPGYYTSIYELTRDDFIKGWTEFKDLLRLAAYYYSEGYRFE